MNRSSTIAMTTTGAIMIRTSTDIAHHCGPRVASCAATSRRHRLRLGAGKDQGDRYSFQAKIRTIRNVATRPGTDSGSTIERRIW